MLVGMEMEARSRQCLLSGDSPSSDGNALVLVSAVGAPLPYTNWRRRVWSPACKKVELPDLRFRDIRSLAATALVSSGVDLKTAQTRLDHSSSRLPLDVMPVRQGGRSKCGRCCGRLSATVAHAVGTPELQAKGDRWIDRL